MKYWYKIIPTLGCVYKYAVVEYYGNENMFTYRTLRYFKDKEKAELYLKKYLEKVKQLQNEP